LNKIITYDHNVVYYIPCYQNNTNPDYPTFTYSMGDATQDEQMAYSMEPDYVLVLNGHFHVTTKE
jgi:hypothetical protein